MLHSRLPLLLLPPRSAAIRSSYPVGSHRRRRRSAPVAPLLPLAGPRRRIAGRLIGAIARIGGITLMSSRADTHYYQDCRDEHCMQFGCRAAQWGYRQGYDEGYREGYRIGWDEGYSAGMAAGYSAGYAAGMAAGYAAGVATCA